jgi:hypothetical protein
MPTIFRSSARVLKRVPHVSKKKGGPVNLAQFSSGLQTEL